MKYYYFNLTTNEMFETDENWCPIGDGIMVEFKGDFEDYKKNKDKYERIGNLVIREGDTVESE